MKENRWHMAHNKVTTKQKQHLVEGFYAPAYMCKNVTADPEYQPIMERINRAWVYKNRTKLSEGVLTKINSHKLLENVSDDIIKAARTELVEAGLKEPSLWMFPISRVNDLQHKNLNGRVYGKELWEKVINEQSDIWKYGTGLANHPAGDAEPDFLNQSILWYGAKIVEDIVYGVGTFLKSKGGDLAEDIISKGGRVGFSTAGFGDVLEEGVVDPNTYEIERLADLVLNPSQGVYGNYEDKYSAKTVESTNRVKESVMAKDKDEILEEEEIEDQEVEGQEDEEVPEEGTPAEEPAEEEVPPEEGEDEETLSESLMKNHYFEKISEVLESNESWRDKIKNLDSLSASIKKESVSDSVKAKVSERIEKSAESLMKLIDSIIPLGFQAKELLEKLQIKNLHTLEKCVKNADDVIAIQEEYEAINKKNTRLQKNLEVAEGKVTNFAQEAYELEEKLTKMTTKAKMLEKRATKSESEVKVLTAKLEKAYKAIAEARKVNRSLSGLLEETTKTNEVLSKRNKAGSQLLSKVRSERNRLVQEERDFEASITGTDPIMDEPFVDEEEYLDDEFLNAYDDFDEYEEDDIFSEDTDELICESVKKERTTERKTSVAAGIHTLADMFNK